MIQRPTPRTRFFSIASAMTCAFFLLTAPAHADESKPGVISVSAVGNAELAPDMATIHLSVVRNAKTAKEALAKNSEAMTKVIAAMKVYSVKDKDLQTSNFNISPRYSQPKRKSNGKQEQPRIIGYTVHNSLTVRVRSLDNLGEVLDQAVTMGVNSGGGIQFSNSNPDEAINQARKNAMEKAVEKAKTLSAAAGVGLGRVLNISEQFRGGPRPIAMAARALGKVQAQPVPVAAGENSYSVSVNVQWELAQ